MYIYIYIYCQVPELSGDTLFTRSGVKVKRIYILYIFIYIYISIYLSIYLYRSTAKCPSWGATRYSRGRGSK